MDGWSWALLAAAGYVAVMALVRLMIARRETIVAQLRRQALAEQRRKQAEARQALLDQSSSEAA